ncbi:hypothetical protein D9619_000983 [Psilocybe cf. subviscida]|uniref:Swi5-dependent recombination DNA repair protein 1 n=1 Tax=Psilocybe cf. subviscida TaxID=2480587 RepID=A0A8H5BFQ7_9AGAR|nr:hypothetical protein D9619_000983 [Psilocybe cf. subviscida]
MRSQGLPTATISGPSLSDFLSAETSSVSDVDKPSSSPVNLPQPQMAMLDHSATDLQSPITGFTRQIAEVGTLMRPSPDNGDRVSEAPPHALDMPYQHILGESDLSSISSEIPGHSNKSSPLEIFNGPESDQCQSDAPQTDEIPRQLDIWMPDTANILAADGSEEIRPRALENSALLSIEDRTGIFPKLDLCHSESSLKRMTLSTLLNPLDVTIASSPSLDSQFSPGTSQPIQALSCEMIDASMERFKSSGGHSDDILSRGDLDEQKLPPKGDGSATTGAPFTKETSTSGSSGVISLTSHWSDDTADTAPSSSLHHDVAGSLHAELTGQTKHSHEKTDLSPVSDRAAIPSSSPGAHTTECLLSNPYFEAATITRTPSPDFRADFVGSDEVPSSSPPSSPSMHSNYLPNSSPLPSSSPVTNSSQTPASSPPTNDRYSEAIPFSDSQQQIYAAESHSPFTRHAMDPIYYKPPEQAPELHQNAAYYAPPLNPQTGSLDAAFADYYDHIAETSAAVSDAAPYHQHNDGYAAASTSSTIHFPTMPMPSASTPYAIPPQYNTSLIDSNHHNDMPYPQVQEPHDSYDSNAYHDRTPYDSTHYSSSVQHENIRPQTDVNSTVTIPQAPDNSTDSVVPRPKRTTLAGQRQQQKKLSKPFRSPVVHAPVRLAPKPVPPESSVPVAKAGTSLPTSSKDGEASSKTGQPQANAAASSSSATTSSSIKTTDTKLKHRTARASSQFKSPLGASATPLDQATLVRLTPTIQSLERKLQLLRRALKVREDVQEEVLEGLVKKWSEAGREAALEVWDAVKDNASSEDAPSGSQGKGKKRAIEDSWGWDDSGDRKKPKEEGSSRNWGWDVVPVSERGEEEADHPEAEGGGDEPAASEAHEEEAVEDSAPQPTLGTMLLQLGIAPDTLGWSEEEGTFVDDS